MQQNVISIKPIKDLVDMKFFIPDYQRGYRWDAQQTIDLLNDIDSFANKAHDTSEIYCIQPLVVQQKCEGILEKIREAKSLDEVEKYMKGSWNVVDGQQRLTTIYLILSYLNKDQYKYEIDYETRDESGKYLDSLSKTDSEYLDKKSENIDFYHIHCVYETVKEWFESNDNDESFNKDRFINTLLNQVCFIWYPIDDSEDAISVFTRLNIGKIPLTDSELIKALFLNRSNFNVDVHNLEIKQHEIAMEWDKIEYTLQNDEFWLFIHEKEYSKPTRIDFIFDLICECDKFDLFEYENNEKEKKDNIHNNELNIKIGNDEHRTFRYFYEMFKSLRENNSNIDFESLWAEVKKYYEIFNEWYHDFKLYHYIGYLTIVAKNKNIIRELLEDWNTSPNKECFVGKLKERISGILNKKSWFSEWENYRFDEENHAKKTDCIELLLLHNIETIVQQNEKLIENKKYNLPNFTKFPFHLYKSENWQVEHIRPNSGDNFKSPETKKVYLLIAKKYLSNEDNLFSEIDAFVRGEKISFDDIVAHVEQINDQSAPLEEEHKNKIWNFTLLDESTNKEYGNAIFPVKRAFIAEKEKGYKVKYTVENGELEESERISEIAFIPPCTKNVFTKFYTTNPSTMAAWTEKDAQSYLEDMKEKISSFIIEEKTE